MFFIIPEKIKRMNKDAQIIFEKGVYIRNAEK